MSGPAEARARMVALKEPERRKLAKEAQRDLDGIVWRGARERPSERWRAAVVCWVGTATARKIASEFWRIGWELRKDDELADDVYAVAASRGAHFFETLARGLLGDEMRLGWPLVRRAVREGLIERPDDIRYVEGIVFGVAPWGTLPAIDSTYDALLADPTLLDEDVWLLFEHDVAGTLANANASVPTGKEIVPGHPQYERGENLWVRAFVRLAAEGRLDRTRLLDASLDALMRDFRASGVGWYATLHEALEPTEDERRARVDRYLALATSSAPAAVKEGLTALKAVGELPADELARVVPSVFAHRQKSLAIEALKLIESRAKKDADARPALLAAAAHALAHERADVQERALKLLERHPAEAPKAELLAYVDAVSPLLRDRVSALTGIEAGAAEPRVVGDRFPEPRVPQPQPGEPLERVRDVDELIELAAALLEGHGDGDDADRFLDGVARLCAERPPRFKQRTAGLMKQAGDATWWRPALSSGGMLVALVVRAWTRGQRPKSTRPNATLGGLLAHRALEVAARAAKRRPRPLAAFPSHVGGWVESAPSRETKAGLFRRGSGDHYDRVAASLRSIRAAGVELRTVVHEGRARFHWDALAPELAGVGEVRDSLEQIGRLKSEWWQEDMLWLAGDELGARWLLTQIPAVPEIQFARAASAVVDFVDSSVYRHPEVVLEQMLSPAVPLRDPAWDVVAASLLAKSPDLQRLAVDVLVTAVEDERYDAEKLGTGLARLLDAGVGSATRLRQPLRDAGRVSPLHAAQVVRGVGEAVARLTTTPHGLVAPLEAAAELSAGCGHRLDGAKRDALERLASTVSPTAKLAKLARTLVAS